MNKGERIEKRQPQCRRVHCHLTLEIQGQTKSIVRPVSFYVDIPGAFEFLHWTNDFQSNIVGPKVNRGETYAGD